MRELKVWSLVGLVGLTVASAGLGWVMAGRFLRPLHDIIAAARRASGATSVSASISAGPKTS